MKGHEPFGLQRQTPTRPAFPPHAPRIGGRTPGPWEQGHGSVVARPPPGCKLRAPGKARGWGASALTDSSVRLLLVFRLHSVAGGGERKETPSLHPGFPHQWVNTAPFPTRRKAVGGPRGELRGELASPRHCVTHFVSREQTLWWKETTKWNWPDAKGLTPPEAEQATETDGAAGPQRGVTRG